MNNTPTHSRIPTGLALQRLGRCPRCGYVLRFDGRNYSCDFCGYPRTPGNLADMIEEMGKDIKTKAQNFLDRMRRPPPRQVYVYYPVAVRTCASCGVSVPLGTARCPKCGTPQEATQTAPVTQRNPTREGVEKNVLDYIIAHNGTISISQAAADLSLPQDLLQSTIEQLKAAGFLSQS